MYAIAVKQTNKSSWQMREKVYDDREKVDNVIEGLRITVKPYKIMRVFYDEYWVEEWNVET